MAATLRIGTSGWEYAHWKGSFYPADLPRDGWFGFYAEHFDTVELNATFYRLPESATFERWADRAPPEFRYAVKASRYLTHIRRLREPEEPLERLWSRARRLGAHRGPMLYQLPPRWRPNAQRLAEFLDAIPPDRDQVLEIRDRRWYRTDILGLLAEAGVGLCLHDMAGSATTVRRPGPIVYLRFHGSGERYAGAYPHQRLVAWADRIAGWVSDGVPVWAYFNNDIGGHAPRDADRLRTYVAQRAG